MKILVTGVAGFIGFSLANDLLSKKYSVVGIDNFDNYYSVNLKKNRVHVLRKFKNFRFYKIDIRNFKSLKKISKIKFDTVYHFAAQPGVRYSLINPKKYYETNVKGFENLLDTIQINNLKKVFYASSSSVYGDQKKFPINEKAILMSKNPYGESKIINENTAKIYSKVLNIPFVGLRLFTVYGPWGRPDMFIIKLLNCFKNNKIFFLNNSGDHYRDFTYIDDVVNICVKLRKKKLPKTNIIFNLCAGDKINILKLSKKIRDRFNNNINIIKNVKADKADVYKTFGDNKKIKTLLINYKFKKITYGLKMTLNWYFKNYNKI